MTQDLECLLAVLRDKSTPSLLDLLQQLQSAFDRAEAENVLPLFLSKLRNGDFTLPEEFELRCVASEREIAVSTFWWTSELKGILAAFAENSIAAILLKGPCMAERLYGAATLRLSRDLDLLIRHKDLSAAGEVLRTLGFARGEDDEGRHETWKRAGTMIELHFDLVKPTDLCMDIDGLFAKAVPLLFAGQPAYILSPADELLFLCIHGIKHSYDQLSYVIDVALAIKQFGIQTNCSVSASEERLVAPILALGCGMARCVDDFDPPPDLQLTSSVARRTAHIAEGLWTLIAERQGPPTIWRNPRRLYLALRPTRFGQMQYLWRVSKSIGDEDRALARGLHIQGRSLISALRQLRLVFKVLTIVMSQRPPRS